MMKMGRLGFLLIFVLTILVPGCNKEALELTPDIASSDEALYRLGEVASKKDAEKAVLYLRQVIDSFPKSFYAQRAKLLIADIYFRKGDENQMTLAADEYREFIRTCPYSPSAAYCQYQIAMTFFKKMPKPGRDPSKTIKALAEFKKIVDDYPVSDQAKPSREKIRECEERLAFHNAEIGILYHNRKAYRAAITPAGIMLASGALGMFLQIVVFGRLHRAAKRSSAAWDDILTNSLRGLILFWTLLAGGAAAEK